jgi:hypothetical protein
MLRMLVPNDPKETEAHSSPAFETDWYGQVSKDLRKLFAARKPRGRWSRVYCGGGSRRKCRRALRTSLAQALSVTREDLYGKDAECAASGRIEASCSDETRSTSASGVSIPAFPLQNRPTYQQTVAPERRLPR